MTKRECTCVGYCKGSSGLAPEWECALQQTRTEKTTMLDRLLGLVQHGKREITFDVEGYSAQQVNQLRVTAEGRGLHVSGYGRWILIRGMVA